MTRVLIASLVSLAVCALWARSYRHVDVIAGFGPASHLQAVGSFRGTLILFLSEVPFGPEMRFKFETASVPAARFEPLGATLFDSTATKASFAGFKLARGNLAVFIRPPGYTAVAVPHWSVVLVTAAAALVWIPALLRRRRWLREGKCGFCGYDLRSSPQRCPECGAIA